MNTAMKEPKEVIEMRESLAEFGRVVRKAKESHRGLPRVVTKPVLAPERDDETTKKVAVAR
jgi:hypothetical protein